MELDDGLLTILVIAGVLLAGALAIGVGDQMRRRGMLVRKVRHPHNHLVVRHNPPLLPTGTATAAMLPAGTHSDAGLEHQGPLLIGQRCRLGGIIRVQGHLAVAAAVEIRGDLWVDGDLVLDETVHLHGTAHVRGDATIGSWCQVDRIECDGIVRVGHHVNIPDGIDAAGVQREHPLQAAGDPLAPRDSVF